MQKRPVLAITMGDPAGIGPEIICKALLHRDIFARCIPVVVGDAAVLADTLRWLGSDLTLRPVAAPGEAEGNPGTLEYIDLGLLQPGSWQMGQVSATAGGAAYQCVEYAIQLAMDGAVDAVVTAPLNKEAMNLAGHHYAGHTEIFAHLTGTKRYAMLLVAKNLRVVHVTTHLSMRQACDAITTARVLDTLRTAALAQRMMGLSGKIAVAGLNAHCSENGLFGHEEAEEIVPAIRAARAEGIRAEGPIPADTVFVKALAGQYDLVVAMYHDQGHIPVKLLGFSLDGRASVSGINCTIGLPIIRTSVDHGTAFDVAGQGIANEESLLDAIQMAITMANSDAPRTLDAAGQAAP